MQLQSASASISTTSAETHSRLETHMAEVYLGSKSLLSD
jgi:hypothetical protein